MNWEDLGRGIPEAALLMSMESINVYRKNVKNWSLFWNRNILVLVVSASTCYLQAIQMVQELWSLSDNSFRGIIIYSVLLLGVNG